MKPFDPDKFIMLCDKAFDYLAKYDVALANSFMESYCGLVDDMVMEDDGDYLDVRGDG
jgi:hypothetical protein